ncbi:hypothetical protein JCM33374_g4156 [Metschnikowia sp. JCM 33374]|nr:hypothetical protein JCM33374_g4156 [Metschnikowia sp. JCM 33374]
MTKVLRVFKLLKMKILKTAAGPGPKTTGLVAAKPTNPTEPSGIKFGEKLYKKTKLGSSKKNKPSKISSTEFSSSKSPSGAFVTETATKTATTTTNNNNTSSIGTGFKGPTTFTKVSGLLRLDHVSKETKPAHANISASERSPHKDGKKSTPIALRFSVRQSVGAEEVGASAKFCEKAQEIPSEISFDRGLSHPDFTYTNTRTQSQ